MSNADRIEELRKKYEENPRRYFAPLANEFRKAGDLGQAIAICREHLPKQPGHMSGYIVFGQTLFEANSLEEARTVFEQALTLDPENLIALKHLGDIARMNGENSIARRWYARVLDADPRNDDIASQLASLGAPTPVTPIPVIPPPAPEPEPVLDDKPGVFATFDPSSLLDVPDAAESIVPAAAESIAEPSFADQVESRSQSALSETSLPDLDDLAMDAPVVAPAPSISRPASSTPFHAIQIVPSAGETDARLEPLDLDFPDNPEPASEEFEEGILAPEWPDTTELVNRVQTPIRSSTPFTNAAIPTSAEAVAAFGRESSDPVEQSLIDIPVGDELVDAFLPPDPARANNAREHSSDFVAELDAAEFHAGDFDANAVELHEFESPLGEVAHEIPVTAQIEDEASVGELPSSDSLSSEPLMSQTLKSETLVELDEIPMPWDVVPEAAPATVADLSTADTGEITVPVQANSVHADAEALAEEFSANFSHDTPAEVVTAEVDTAEVAAAEVAAAEIDATEVVAASASEIVDDAELPFDAQVTAEFPIAGDWTVPVESSAVADVASEDVVEMSGERWEAPKPVQETVEAQVHTFDADLDVEPVAALPVAELPEESFAEVSSAVESEREAELEAAREEETPTFVTETMAELLLSQGHVSRAIEVYDELVRRRPNDVVLAARLTELRETERAEIAQAELLRAELHRAELARIARLASEQTSIPTPALGTPAITPLYSTPHRGIPSFTQHVSTSGTFAAQAGAQQSFRTARERFAELAGRRVARRTPTHATAVSDDQAEGLSSLFGTSQPTTTDELAARALAEAFGPVEDSGESLFDPAPMPTPVVPLRALTPRSVAPISAPAPSNPEHRSERQPSPDYSFDKFFPDPAMTSRDAQTAHSSTATAQDPTQPVNEDLAQFSAWLKGLNNA